MATTNPPETFVSFKPRLAVIEGTAAPAEFIYGDPLAGTARREAQSWTVVSDKGRCATLANIQRQIARVLQPRINPLKQAAEAHSEDEKWVSENAVLLRSSVQAIKDATRSAAKLMQVETRTCGQVPRAFAAVESYLRAVHYKLDQESLITFLSAAQEQPPFDMGELWMLKTFLQLALLHRVSGFGFRVSGISPIPDTRHPAPISVLITSLREISDLDWKEIFEALSETDHILRDDPAGAYSATDFENREIYRRVIADLAARSGVNERDVAQQAISLAYAAQTGRPQGPPLPAPQYDDRARERRSHVGYYLVAEGRKTLEKQIGYSAPISKRLRDGVLRYPEVFYFSGIGACLMGLMGASIVAPRLGAWAPTRDAPTVAWLMLAVLFLFPAAECAVALMNQITSAVIRPKTLPKLDFSHGIPASAATVAVVPTLLVNEKQVRRAASDLEIRYLGNRDPNLHFALLTDLPDSPHPEPKDHPLVQLCSKLIRDLNAKYAGGGKGPFLLLHRRGIYDASEGVWMGWERKRGKLLEFNDFLLGARDAFAVKVGDVAALRDVRYVITLDLDTQLPRDVGRRLIGAMHHPLNRAVVDSASGIVTEGYAILQPRVGISAASSRRSRLAAMFAGETGFDIYTLAVSDVYQDLFGEATFTGKGIYDLDVFQQVLRNRFPENTLLSHDLIEGAFARTGLVSDITIIDDYPSHVSAFSRRKHRWIRGDWQVLPWLFNPVRLISRWKILDNLRRSVTEPATLLLLISACMLRAPAALYWTLITLGVLALPRFTQAAFSVSSARRALLTGAFWWIQLREFFTEQARLFLRIALLLQQSLVSADAVVRACVRMKITHKNLLQWETAAESEAAHKTSLVDAYLSAAPWIALALGITITALHPWSIFVGLPLLMLWGASVPLVKWLDAPCAKTGIHSASDQLFLRTAALRTWRFFREFSVAGNHWLIPDTVQQDPVMVVQRLSPTNLGFLLNARLAAHDLGYLTLPEMISITEKSFDSMDRLPKWNGHFFNWYDARTLEALPPLFVSTVDNGNLVCCLWTIKQGCLESIGQPLFGKPLWTGVQDHLDLIETSLEQNSHNGAALGMLRQCREQLGEWSGSDADWSRLLGIMGIVSALKRELATRSVDREAAWWAHELFLRLRHIAEQISDFAPWLLPEFSKLLAMGQLPVPPVSQLTLDSIPDIVQRIDRGISLSLQGWGREQRRSSGSAGILPALSLLRWRAGRPRSQLAWCSTQLLRSSLARSAALAVDAKRKLNGLAYRAGRFADAMDFAPLYDQKKKLLTVGYDLNEGRRSEYHYDFLASEARMAVFSAIAKGEIPQESWFHLDRTQVRYKGNRVLVSWSGTLFEYLMPSLWMESFPGGVMELSCRAAVAAQRRFLGRKAIAWGISESAYSERHADGQYRYHAFGVPALGLNRDAGGAIIVSPYSSFLSLLAEPQAALENLRRMAETGWIGAYGFYEAVDFTGQDNHKHSGQVVRSWMAHHQGMSLVAVANILCDCCMQRRFHTEPAVAATANLLHEKPPSVPAVEPQQRVEADAATLLSVSRKIQMRRASWNSPIRLQIPA